MNQENALQTSASDTSSSAGLQAEDGLMLLLQQRPWLNLMPDRQKTVAPVAFSNVALQMVALEQPPLGVEPRTLQGRTIYYLPITQVEPELFRIFGSRNVLFFPLRITYDDGQTRDGLAKVIVTMRLLLVVRYADGEDQHCFGIGVADYLPHNYETDLSDAVTAAQSYAVRRAARLLGRHFGSGLDIEEGLRIHEETEERGAAQAIMVLAESGKRLWYDTDIEMDVLITPDNLDTILQDHGIAGVPLAQLEGKALLNTLSYLRELPTKQEKEGKLAAIEKIDPTVTEDTPYYMLLQIEREVRKRQGGTDHARNKASQAQATYSTPSDARHQPRSPRPRAR